MNIEERKKEEECSEEQERKERKEKKKFHRFIASALATVVMIYTYDFYLSCDIIKAVYHKIEGIFFFFSRLDCETPEGNFRLYIQ